MWNEFLCFLASAKAVWTGSTVQTPPASLLCKGTSRGFRKFSKLSLCRRLCWLEKRMWWVGRVGLPSAGARCGGEGSCGWRALSRAHLEQGLAKARLWVLHPEHKLLLEQLAAVMLGVNQNLLWTLIPLVPLKKTQVPSYLFIGNRKIMIWRSFSLRFQNSGLMISLPEHRNTD